MCYKNINEAIELVKYYLKNNEEREKKAKAGYDRAMKNYTYEKVFDKHLKYILGD